jgi:hypothetical protein
MNDEPITVTLSRDELLLTLRLLEAETILGLDDDPYGPMDEDQRALAHVVAGRGLRARGLAQLNEEGELALHEGVLTAVGTCAYAQKSLILSHWSPEADTPLRYFAHVREEQAVVHTKPGDVLHQLVLLPDQEELPRRIMAFCGCDEMVENGRYEFTIPAQAFAQARQRAEASEEEKAVELLVERDILLEAAKALAKTLLNSDGLKVTIFQLWRRVDERPRQREFTILHTAVHSWLLMSSGEEEPDTDEERVLLVKTTTAEEVMSLLIETLL